MQYEEDRLKSFDATSEDTGNIGKPGHDGPATWNKFNAKYRRPCMSFVIANYPMYREEAEDVFQAVARSISNKAEHAERWNGEKFRSVLCRLCRWEIERLHPVKRRRAERRFRSLASAYLFGKLFPNYVPRSERDRRRRELADVVIEELLDPEFENGRYTRFLDERSLGLWRRVVTSESKRPGTVARQLGLPRKEVTDAFNEIAEYIREEVGKLGKDLDYLRCRVSRREADE